MGSLTENLRQLKKHDWRAKTARKRPSWLRPIKGLTQLAHWRTGA
jgi:hypothetical protein